MPRRRSILSWSLGLLLAPWVARAEPALPGAVRPAMAGVTSRGERVSLEALRGSVVLVFVWSARCPVCLDKLPELRRNLEGWQGKPFVIVALNHDRTVDQLLNYERALDQTGAARPQLKTLWRGAVDHRDNFGELPPNMPTAMILDKTGALRKTVRGRVPAELWDDIAELVLE